MIIRRIIFIFMFIATTFSPGLILAGECFESSIVSPTPFLGNNEEMFKLSDGSVWEVKYEYEYLYEYDPSVIVCPGRGKLIINEKSLNVELLSQPSNKNGKSGGGWEVREETNLLSILTG